MSEVNFIPVLSKGSHKSPKEGACVMEMVSFLAGEEWSDFPECSDTYIAHIAQMVNDEVDPPNRHLILKDFNRLFNTRFSTSATKREFTFSLAKYFSSSPSHSIISLAWAKNSYPLLSETDTKTNLKIDLQILAILTKVLDIYDEVTGRTAVEKQDISKLKELQLSP